MHFYTYVYGLFSLLDAIHFPLVTYVLGVFQCTSDPLTGISYLTDHPYLLCNSISTAGKVIPLLLYPVSLVGFFLVLAIYLHYSSIEVKESAPVLQSFGFFYIRFKPDRVASGAFFILINLTLSLVVGLLQPNNDVFPTLIVGIVQVDFFFVTVFQPYLQPRYNKVRATNDIVSLLLFVNNVIYTAQTQFPTRTASPAVIYCALNLGMLLFYGYHIWKIFQLHRGDLQLIRANSGPVHRSEPRHHLELLEIKRKQTNIDPPSTTLETQTYTAVPRSPPAELDNTTHTVSGLPIISEHEGSEGVAVTKLVFTENPLADNGGTFHADSADPPSPSSSKGGLSDSIADERGHLHGHNGNESGSETPL